MNVCGETLQAPTIHTLSRQITCPAIKPVTWRFQKKRVGSRRRFLVQSFPRLYSRSQGDTPKLI